MSKIRGTVRGFALPRWSVVAAGSPTLTVPRIDRTPALHAPTLSIPATQTITAPRITRTPALHAPVLSIIASGTITVPRITRTPVLHAPVLSVRNVTLPIITRTPVAHAPVVQLRATLLPPRITRTPQLFTPTIAINSPTQTLSLPRISRVPTLFAPSFGLVTQLASIRDPNPFPPTVPEAIKEISPELYDYLQYQARSLRQFAKEAQAGAQSWPIEYLALASATPAYPVGSKGRFLHPTFGLIRAVYCQFTAMIQSTGWPVGFADESAWLVTNAFTQSKGQLAVGFLPAEAPPEGFYGWVITEGFLPNGIELEPGTVYQFGAELVWSSSGKLDYESEGQVLGRIVGQDLSAGSILAGAGTSNGTFATKQVATRVSVLEASEEDSRARVFEIETAFANGEYATASQFTELSSSIGTVSASLEVTNRTFASADQALAQQLNVLRADFTNRINAEIERLVLVDTSSTQSLALLSDSLTARFGAASAATATVENLTKAVADAQSATAQIVGSLQSTIFDEVTGLGATATALTTLTTTVSTLGGDLTAVTTRTTNLESTVNNGSTGVAATFARLTTEETTRANADTALSGRATALESTVNNGSTGVAATYARLLTEETTRANADSAFSSSILELQARTGNSLSLNPVFAAWPGGSGTAPSSWVDWANLATNVKVTPGVRSPNAIRFTVIANNAYGLTQNIDNAAPGYYFLELDLKYVSGSWVGSGVLLQFFDSAVNYLADAQIRPDVDKTIDGTVVSSPVSGRTYRWRKLVLAPANTVQLRLFALASWDGFNGTRPAKTIEFHAVGVIPADQTDAELIEEKIVRANADSAIASDVSTLSTTVGGHTTSITSQTASINGIQAKRSVTIDANGAMTGYELIGGGGASAFKVRADQIQFFGPSGVGGNAPFAVDTTSGEVKIAGRIVIDTGTHMLVQGQGFGTSSQFVQWYGPKMALNLCSEANATFYLKNNGTAYYAGGFSAGILTTKAATSSTAANAEAETATYGSNGGTITISLSASASFLSRIDYLPSQAANFNADKGTVSPTPTLSGGVWSIPDQSITPAVAIELYRSINGGGYSLVGTYNINGSRGWQGVEPNGSDPGYSERDSMFSGSFTYTDPSNLAQNRKYKAVLTGRNMFWGSSADSQLLAIVSVEV